MGDESVALVEVQYLPDMLVNNAFDLVYHEHRQFFSLTSLEAAAARHGLHAVDAELTDRQGGSIRVTLAKKPHHSTRVATIRRSEQWLNSFGAYESMQARAERIRWRLKSLVLAQDADVVVYGAAAKTTTLLNFCGLTSEHIKACVDSTPAKQGRFIPGTGIPIKAHVYSKPGSPVYLLGAWNYAEQIMAANPGRRWILPIPSPMVVVS
jgi:methylation protein EvaC